MRRRLVPAPDRAREALAGIGPADGPLREVLARRLARMSGEAVAPADFDLDRVPAHLLVRFRIEDGDGREVASGRDLDALRRDLGREVRAAVAEAAPGVERRGLTAWEIGDLPRVVDTTAGGQPVRGYPALVDEGATAGVRVLASEPDQARAMAAGTRRLLLLAVPAARRTPSAGCVASRRWPRSRPATPASPRWPTTARPPRPTASWPPRAGRRGTPRASPAWWPARARLGPGRGRRGPGRRAGGRGPGA